MDEIFLHMGCDLKLSKEAAKHTDGVTLLEQMPAGSKLTARDYTAQTAYFAKYKELFEKQFGYPIGYREISSAPEQVEIAVMWRSLQGGSHEFGRAIRYGNRWYIKSDPNPHANGYVCAKPFAWHD